MSDSERVVPLHARSALQSRTPDDIANEQTAEQLALRIWTAMVARKVLRGMSARMFPDINAVANLLPSSDPDIARDADQLRDVLAKCAVGATEFKEKFSRTQLERMVRRGIEARFKKDPECSRHIREEVPGVDIKKYGPPGAHLV